MKREYPGDTATEEALLGACLLSDTAIEDSREIITPGDFLGIAHQHIYTAILTAHAHGQVDSFTVAEQLRAAGLLDEIGGTDRLVALTRAMPTISNAARYARIIADYAVRRSLILRAAEITELGWGEHDAGVALDRARDLLAGLDVPNAVGAPDPDVDSFIDHTDVSYDWLLPGFLERGDRMLVTAGEGVGKSYLLAQIAVQTAAGVHPWTLKDVPARNVLYVDLENNSRLVARRMRTLRDKVKAKLDPQRLRIHPKPEGLDLTARSDRMWLMDRVRANAAELLVIGPAYRMSAGPSAKGDIGGEDQARNVTKALDELRNRYGVALLMETHAPHGGIGGRDLRPFGSSVWLRWPEFGIGIRKDPDDQRDRFLVQHWRGPRDQRTWPVALHRNGGFWPWSPEMPTGTFTEDS